MKRLAIAALLVGCGGKPAPVTTPPPDNGGGTTEAAPVYAKLFVDDARWTFDVHTLDDSMSDTAPSGFETTEDDLQASCSTGKVETFGDAKVVEVECDENWPNGEMPLRGVWAMDARGLWMVDDWGGDPPTLEGTPTIANPPVAWHVDEKGDDGEVFGETNLVEEDGAWCWKWGVTQGDAAWSTICFADGPVRGDQGWSGAEEHSFTFERAD